MEGSHWADTLENVATFTRPASMPFRLAADCISAWWAAHSFSIWGSSARPSAVSTTPPRLRLSSVTPSSSSSDCTAWLTPDCVKLSASAALEKLPQAAVFKNIWYLVMLTGSPRFLPSFYHTFAHSCKYNNAFYKYQIVCYHVIVDKEI